MRANDIYGGLRVIKQQPLDTKLYFFNEDSIIDLGVNDNLAYTYYKGMPAYSVSSKKSYVWEEVTGETRTPIVDGVPFTYPANWVVNDIDYSNKTFNFFLTDISTKTYSVANIVTEEGMPGLFYKDVTVVGNNTQFNFKNLKTSNLVITSDANSVFINMAEITDIPRFIVNSAYNGDEELGTLSKPFKDIPQAVEAFLDLGSAASIVIQKGNGYSFTGNIVHDNLTVELEAGTLIGSNPVNGWFCDTSVVPDDEKLNFTLILGENSLINLFKSGFRNNGTNVDDNAFTTFKRINIKGSGFIIQSTIDTTTGFPYVIFESNFANIIGFKNDSSTFFEVDGITIASQTQPIRKIGGDCVAIFKNIRSTVANPGVTPNAAMVPFQQTGGFSIIDENFTVDILTPNLTIFSFSKNASFPCVYKQYNCSTTGNIGTLYTNTTILEADVQILNSGTRATLNVVNVITSPLVLWNSILFHNNFISTTVNPINLSQVDLTMTNSISVSNKIGANIIEYLRQFDDQADAVINGLPIGAVYINTTDQTRSIVI